MLLKYIKEKSHRASRVFIEQQSHLLLNHNPILLFFSLSSSNLSKGKSKNCSQQQCVALSLLDIRVTFFLRTQREKICFFFFFSRA